MAQKSLQWRFLPPSPLPAPFSFAPDEPVRLLLSLGLLSEKKAENKNDTGYKNKSIQECFNEAETSRYHSDFNRNL